MHYVGRWLEPSPFQPEEHNLFAVERRFRHLQYHGLMICWVIKRVQMMIDVSQDFGSERWRQCKCFTMRETVKPCAYQKLQVDNWS
jgi:menaquinone-dependent protoporphyrinogen IX oxidase